MFVWRRHRDSLAELETELLAELAARDATAAAAERWAELEAKLTSLSGTEPAHNGPPWAWVPLLPLVKAIRAHPDLSRLAFHSSLWFLCPNRCTKYPFSEGYPAILAGEDGQIEVYVHPWTLVGKGDADEVIRLIVQHLPPYWGPAFDGSVEDLERIEGRLWLLSGPSLWQRWRYWWTGRR